MAQRAKKTLLFIGGRPVHCLIGAEGEGGSGDGGQGQGGQGGSGGSSGGNGGQNNNGSQSGSGDGGNGQGQSAQGKTYSQAEFDALQARMSAADRNAAEAAAKLKERDDKDKSELELAQQEAKEAKEERDALKASRESMLVTNAFLQVKDSPSWHDASVAQRLLDESVITVDDKGKVSGMEAAVKKLATDHPYLVKPSGDGKDDKNGNGKNGQQQNGGGGGGNNGSSGTSNNGGSGGGQSGPDRAKLAKTYPAMRSRVR